MLEKLEGIIIKTQNYGETHKIVTLFTKKLGKISGIARGAKKPKSRMAAVTQPFIYGEFLVYVQSGLSTMQQGEVIQSLRAIREDIIKTAYAAYIIELTDKLLESREPDGYLYDQLFQTLTWIADNEESEVPMMMYELKMYQKGGFAPTVDHCVNCGKKASSYTFSIAEGGLLCERCQYLDPQSRDVSPVIPKLLQLFLNVGLEQVGNISVKEENRTKLRTLLDAYYDQYGGYYIKSRKFLQQLDKLM
ncbi:DNA repair protein RecO [Oceanobacillus halotolerans]|uniref:DNA repair protein RecO n=1 Tax=Oceanobacillus halotolerans TaxID=2663380 RepID=UPI0013DC663F|nr:DNA repair protein RecO [Oceanobacillus halotolerans]